MNTAARMESTGVAGRIQLSKDTAELLIHANKEAWLSKRPEGVEAKGKGVLETYFLNLSHSRETSTAMSGSDETGSLGNLNTDLDMPTVEV